MRWIAVLALWLVLAGPSRAAGPDDLYLDVYNEILQADGLQQSGHSAEAVAKYIEAQSSLKKLKSDNPAWNSAIVSYRLDYLAERIQALSKLLPAPTSPPPQAAAPVQTPAPVPAAAPAPSSAMEIAGLQEHIRSLNAVNVQLENKLKEALSIQPAAATSQDLAKLEEKIVMLQKEKDLLTVALQQAKFPQTPGKADKAAGQPPEASPALADLKARSNAELQAVQTELAQVKNSLAEAQAKIAADATEIDALKAPHASENSSEIAVERDKLKAELAARTRDLADAEAHRNSVAAPPAATPAPTDTQVEQLRARLAILEAQPVPYTPEELAIMKNGASPATTQAPLPAPVQAPATPPAQGPDAPAESKHIVHTLKDLPPGAGGLMLDAHRAVMQRDYAKAAGKYQEILRQDPNNVFVLAYLATSQFAQGQLADCEKTVKHALSLDPDDPASLYTLGILRYREEKLDEALDALSRSAKYSPTNAPTHYYLGNVLFEKGLRTNSETAYRTALKFEPNYADAHFGLACVYASEKPPSLELARWHYRKALELGHDKNAPLEKILESSP